MSCRLVAVNITHVEYSIAKRLRHLTYSIWIHVSNISKLVNRPAVHVVVASTFEDLAKRNGHGFELIFIHFKSALKLVLSVLHGS